MLKTHHFFVINKKTIIAALICFALIVAFCATYFPIKASASPKPLHTIVIDAGHGGRDGGATGKVFGTSESEINLKYALSLKQKCENLGFKVVLTRKDDYGLYSPFAANKKRSDMEKRRDIIKSSKADLVISVHMNAFNGSLARGAQVFYGLDNELGKALADSIQTSLHSEIDYAKSVAKEGDYYILNCTSLPGALIEFGFLSNAEEEKLLVSDDYRNRSCEAVARGILQFFEM